MAKIMPPEGARSFAEHGYAAIKRDIINGRLRPGMKLPLQWLMQQYSLGMAPLREALTKLTGETFVVAESQKGFRVAKLSLAEFDDLWRVRKLIESEALVLSIQNRGVEWRRRLTDAYARLREIEDTLVGATYPLAEDNTEEWEARNQVFHNTLLSACDSPWLLQLKDMTYQKSLRYRLASKRVPSIWRRVDDEHAAIFEAAMAGEILRAVRANEYHIDQTATKVRQLIPQTATDNPDASAIQVA